MDSFSFFINPSRLRGKVSMVRVEGTGGEVSGYLEVRGEDGRRL